jgi:hypothetical protein
MGERGSRLAADVSARRLTACLFAVLTVMVLAATAGALRQAASSATETVAEGETGSATARCKAGTEAVSGGFRGEFDPAEVVSGNSPQLQVYESRLRPERGWVGAAYNQGATGELTAFVDCRARGPKVESKARTVDGTPFMGVTRTGEATARCPAGTRVIGGGFGNPTVRVTGDYENDNRILPYISRKAGPRSWTVEAANFGGADGTLVAYAYCQDVPSLRTKRTTATFTAPPDEVRQGSTVARCPRGQRVVSGGFKVVALDPHVVASRKVGARRWKASASVPSPGQTKLTAYAYCRG